MRRNVKALVEITKQLLGLPEPIVGIGAYQTLRRTVNTDLRQMFHGKHYIGCNVRLSLDVDRVEDTEALTFQTGYVGSVLMIDSLEHLLNCRQTMSEVYRVLQPGGVVIATSATDLAVDEQPDESWRFAPEAYKQLFEPFERTLVGYQGNLRKPHTVFALAVKRPRSDVTPALARIQEAYYRTNSTLFWRMAQVFDALRDLSATLRRRDNQIGFELVTREFQPEAEHSDLLAQTQPLAGEGSGTLFDSAMQPISSQPGYILKTSIGGN